MKILFFLLFCHLEQYAADHYVTNILICQPLMVVGVTGGHPLAHRHVAGDFLSSKETATTQVPRTVVKIVMEIQLGLLSATSR
jgi:hypothetical protein